MIVAIHQPHYLPWLRYMHKIASCDVFVLLDDAQYTKNGWQNRNRIKGPQGPVLLTVPVRDPAFLPINRVEIDSGAPWREKHWKSIKFNYARAPHFGRYGGIMEETLEIEWTKLADLNLNLLTRLLQAMGIGAPLVLSSSLGVAGHGTERLVEICRRLGATKYLSGDFALQNHLEEHLFRDHGIALTAQTWQCPQYLQQFPKKGFITELSVLDLLLNEGPASLRTLMRGSAAQMLAPAAESRESSGSFV